MKQTNCLANTRKAIEASRKAGIPVIHVTVAFREGYPELSEKFISMSRQVGALIEGSWGAQIHDEVGPQLGEIVVRKRAHSAFYGTDLEFILHNNNIRYKYYYIGRSSN